MKRACNLIWAFNAEWDDSSRPPEVKDEGCDAQHRKAGARLAARNGGESKQGMLPFNSINSPIRVLLFKKKEANCSISLGYLHVFLSQAPASTLSPSLICHLGLQRLFWRKLLTDLPSVNGVCASAFYSCCHFWCDTGTGKGRHYKLRFWSMRRQRTDTFGVSTIKTESHTLRPILGWTLL